MIEFIVNDWDSCYLCSSLASPPELSLDQFLARNISEDDDSFEQIMEDAKQKFMHKVTSVITKKFLDDWFI